MAIRWILDSDSYKIRKKTRINQRIFWFGLPSKVSIILVLTRIRICFKVQNTWNRTCYPRIIDIPMIIYLSSFDWLIRHSYLVSGPKSPWRRMRYFCIAPGTAQALSSSTFWGLTRYLIRAPQHYLTLAEFGRCPKFSHRNEWRSLEELGIRVVLISCTWLLIIQITQLSPFIPNQVEIVWTCCDYKGVVQSKGF